MANPSRSIRAPNTRNKAAAKKLVNLFGINVGTAWPRTAERIVIAINAENAAEKTRSLSCFMAIRAAIKNVLSPISEKRIMVSESIYEWKGWIRPSLPSSSGRLYFGEDFVSGFEISRWSLFAEFGRGCGRLLGVLGRSFGFCHAD